jgi:hypothetical protein
LRFRPRHEHAQRIDIGPYGAPSRNERFYQGGAATAKRVKDRIAWSAKSLYQFPYYWRVELGWESKDPMIEPIEITSKCETQSFGPRLVEVSPRVQQAGRNHIPLQRKHCPP